MTAEPLPADDEPEFDGTPQDGTLPPAERPWPRPWQSLFLRSLSLIPGVSEACRHARISRTSAYNARQEQPDFAQAWDEAIQLAHDFVQRQAHQWITTGLPAKETRTTTKRILNPATGELVSMEETTVVVEKHDRSAAMMMMWLRAWNPSRYKDVSLHEHSGTTTVLIKPEEIQREIDRRVDELAARRAAKALDPAPEGAVGGAGSP